MDLLTKKHLIDTVVERWKKQYPDTKKDITNKLIKLNPKTEKEIVDIIGNESWTENICCECEKDVDILVELGEEYNCESYTTWVCIECLKKAIKLIEDERKNNK